MRRWPLWGRLALIVGGTMLVLQLVAIGVQISRDDGFTVGGIRPAFARQVASLTRLFDRMVQPGRRAIALDILNASDTTLSIVATPPEGGDNGLLLGFSAHNVAQRIIAEGVPAERLSIIYVPDGANAGGPLARLFGRHLRIVVALRSGDFLVIEPDSDVNSFVFGTFASLAAGILGLAGLGIVVFAIYRQTRPLGSLAANMERFARTAEPSEMQEAGAKEIRTLIGATNQMQQRIATLIRNRALLLAGMSHDLRTQVTRLRLRLELLPDSETRRRAIADVEAMQALTEETLEFAQAGSASEGGRCDAIAVLTRVVEAQAAAWPGSATLAPTQGALAVAIAETPFRRVVENLIDNAIAYGISADVSIESGNGVAMIRVADRGPGIPPGERAEIFEPYYRLEPSRGRAGGGTGLGLAIVQQIVARHGGTVMVADREGGGSVFTVTLPLMI